MSGRALPGFIDFFLLFHKSQRKCKTTTKLNQFYCDTCNSCYYNKKTENGQESERRLHTVIVGMHLALVFEP